MTGGVLLALAIGCEVAATLMLKASADLARPIVALPAVAAYAVAFYCLARSLESLPVGLAYAIWAGAGTVGVALLGALFFREAASATAWLGMALVVAGVIVLGASAP